MLKLETFSTRSNLQTEAMTHDNQRNGTNLRGRELHAYFSHRVDLFSGKQGPVLSTMRSKLITHNSDSSARTAKELVNLELQRIQSASDVSER